MWINGVLYDGWIGWNAKVFGRPSIFGMDENGRVSKLYVAIWNEDEGDWDELYMYDRGSCSGAIEEEILRDVLDAIG